MIEVKLQPKPKQKSLWVSEPREQARFVDFTCLKLCYVKALEP